MTLCTTRCE